MKRENLEKATELINDIEQIEKHIKEAESCIKTLKDEKYALNVIQYSFDSEEDEERHHYNLRIDRKPIRDTLIELQKTAIRHLNIDLDSLKSDLKAL